MDFAEKVVIKYEKDTLNTIELIIHGECHTIANLIRDKILKNKSCTFCAYKMAHPHDDFVSMRISALEDKPVRLMILESLRELSRDIGMLSADLGGEQ